MKIFTRSIAVASLTGALLASTANAQQRKTAIAVELSGQDSIGQQLAYTVREELRRSSAYEVSIPKDAVFSINIVSIDLALPNEQRGGSAAVAISYTMSNFIPYKAGDPQTWYPIYLTTEVMAVGRNRVDTQAKSIVATLDQEIEKFRGQASR